MWAILSGIEGNLLAYEAVLADCKQQRVSIDSLYLIGDLVGPRPESEEVLRRLRFPAAGELTPQVCIGWWEEQCFILHGVGTTSEPRELLQRYGGDTVELLWKSVSRESVEWLRGEHFGFIELDSLLAHGSSVSASDELTPETPPWEMLDRLQRAGVNRIFCGRSGRAFDYELEGGAVSSAVKTLDSEQPVETIAPPKGRVIGVGNVGRTPGEAVYALYNPNSDRLQFQTVRY
jgi:hypothetical protein